ncbi:MAG: glycosyl hydrolase [Bacillota bacterium]|nr:MAG: glycosyl hydrolase [Bacillota bacterium]
MDKVKIGIIGLGQRGSGLTETILSLEDARIVAVSDVYEDRREIISERVNKAYGERPAAYADYREILADKAIDAVLITAGWEEHIKIAIESMRAGKITAMEVGGAYDIEECWELVRAYEETKTPIMMMENCCYDRFELLSTAMVRAGKFGEIVHCHGAYSHDLRDEILGGNVNRHYRLNNYMRRNCENYPTHELGPIAKILNINRGNRMLSLVSVASKAAGLKEFSLSDKNPDKSLAGKDFAQGDIVNTVIRCAGGETISLTLDTTLPKYYSREFTVRGTKGLANQELNMILLEGEQKDIHEIWEPHRLAEKYLNNAKTYEEKFLHSIWKDITPEEMELGHGGMDYLMFREFFKTIKNGGELPIDVYDAAAWMCVSALSEQSIARGGAPVDIPDFTKGQWVKRAPKDVLKFD